MSKFARITGIILKRSNYRDTDKIVTLYTLEQGKISVLAKGLRKSTKRASSLELFNHINGSLVQGRGELQIITEVSLISSFSSWRHHLGRVNLAYQLCEALDKLTPTHQPHPELYHQLVSHLSSLGTLGVDWQTTLDSWLLGFVKDLGFFPHDQQFSGNLTEFIEELASVKLNSHRLLAKLKSTV